jgi:hypothetical protein
VTGTQHDTSVKYSDQAVPGEVIDAAKWKSWSYTEDDVTYYYAKGPCPACAAEAQGKVVDTAPIEGQGADGADAPARRMASDTVEIPLRCHCGFAHGSADASNCGRSWTIVVQPTQ